MYQRNQFSDKNIYWIISYLEMQKVHIQKKLKKKKLKKNIKNIKKIFLVKSST